MQTFIPQAWTTEEHDRFVTALEEYGCSKDGRGWEFITADVGNGRTLAEVWRHAEKYLLKLQVGAPGNVNSAQPRLSSGKWTWEENSKFEDALAAVAEGPDRWKKIAKLLPGKSATMVHKHYQQLVYDLARIEAGKTVTRNYHPQKEKKHAKKRRKSVPL